MLIKESDNNLELCAELRAKLEQLNPSAVKRKEIEDEIHKIEQGVRGERAAADIIESEKKDSNNWAIIHDLRIKHEGGFAQIDHLLISRWLEIWVCETKNYNADITIDECGNFKVQYRRDIHIKMPIEQNEKHISVLRSIFESGRIKLPTRLGITLGPQLNNAVLVSKDFVDLRPKTQNNTRVIKIDDFMKRVHQELDDMSDLNAWRCVLKLVSQKRLRKFAKELSGLHEPDKRDWPTRLKFYS